MASRGGDRRLGGSGGRIGVSAPGATAGLEARLDELAGLRDDANEAFFTANAEALARCCHAMAERFARGGRLVALGATPTARSDARHVAVEFVHPVIVGKRALPAIALVADGGDIVAQTDGVLGADDIAIAFGVEEEESDGARKALALASGRGCMTLAFAESPAEWIFEPRVEDPFVRQELIETLYHVLWELVHVFFDHRGLLEGREARAVHDTGASSFLYPFLAEAETDLGSVLDDVRSSILMKAEEIGALRRETIEGNREALLAAAAGLRASLDRGGKALVFGNGGSATDAIDLVADLRGPPRPDWPARRAVDLTEDAGIITAIANDVGVGQIFQRQLIALGTEGDVAIALSTSGNSENIVVALAEARSRGISSVAMVGYDGGRIAAERLADHVIVTSSQNIPRIQEAQAGAYHVLRELIELAESPVGRAA